MIIARLNGGLGNQLFQYAAGRALAVKHNSELRLDITNYSIDNFRKFELDQYNINSEIASFHDLLRYCKFQAFVNLSQHLGLEYYPTSLKIKLLMYRDYFDKTQLFSLKENIDLNNQILYSKIDFFSDKHIFIEPHLNYSDDFINIPDNSYIIGFWQSERYFETIKDILQKELCLKHPITKGKYFDQIINNNSVSIHVRRGDKTNSSSFYPTEIAYIEKSIEFIRKRVDSPMFFIFSDEIDWVKKNLQTDVYSQFISGTEPTEDLFYMSQCKHNIIGESSFSWWGAWLNNNPKKIVLTPDPSRWIKYFSGTTNDIFPEEWKVII